MSRFSFGARFIVELVILLALTMVLLSQRANAFGLKGVEVGQPWSDTGVSTAFGDQWNGAADLAGITASVVTYKSGDSVLAINATFPSYGFAPIRDALIAKYGKPRNEVKLPLQNALGARVTSYVLTWHNTNGDRMVLMSAIGEIGTGALKIDSAEQVKSEKPKDNGI